MGKFTKGHKTNLGKKFPNKKRFSIETRKKMSLARLGKKYYQMTAEVKEKIRKAKLGKKMSEDAKLKMSLSRIGRFKKEDNPNWKGGKTKENDLIRTSDSIKLWKKAVMERDNYTCQKTGQLGGELVVHHIHNFADYPELRTSIDNGIVLSKKSHILFHHIYGRKNNTKEQLLEFLSNK